MSSNNQTQKIDENDRSNLEKQIKDQLLKPIQIAYAKKKIESKPIEEKTDSKFMSLLEESMEPSDTPSTLQESNKEDDAKKMQSWQDLIVENERKELEQPTLPLPPPPSTSQELVLSKPNEEFKSYLEGLKMTITDHEDDEYDIDEDSQKELIQLIDDKLVWLENNPNASEEDIKDQEDALKENIEEKVSSISDTWHEAPPEPPTDGRCIADSYEIKPEEHCNLETGEPKKQEKFRLHPDKNPCCTK